MENLKFDPRTYLNDRDPKSMRCRDTISWLNSSHIHYDVSHLPMINEKQVRDLWKTADYDFYQKPEIIKEDVMCEAIVVSADTIAMELKLEGEVGHVVLLSDSEVHDAFVSIGYEGTKSNKRKEIYKSCVSKE